MNPDRPDLPHIPDIPYADVLQAQARFRAAEAAFEQEHGFWDDDDTEIKVLADHAEHTLLRHHLSRAYHLCSTMGAVEYPQLTAQDIQEHLHALWSILGADGADHGPHG